MTAAAQEILEFRGAWASGMSFRENDITVTGRWSWRCILDHVAGTQSQPGHGAHWTRFWLPIDGFGRIAGPFHPKVSPSLVSGDGVVQLPVVSVPPAASPPAVTALPAEPLAASRIADDSDNPQPNLAMTLSWIKAVLAQTARREDIEADLRQLEGQLRDLADRLVNLRVPSLTPIRAEVMRRKARVLCVAGPAEVAAAELRMMREQIRLLRLRDKGSAFTARDAALFQVLDSVTDALAAIEAAAEALEATGTTLLDVTEDVHWPPLGETP